MEAERSQRLAARAEASMLCTVWSSKIPAEETSYEQESYCGFVCSSHRAAAVATGVYSQEKKEGGDAHKIVHYGDLKWTPIMKGCDLATVAGDPSADGAPFVVAPSLRRRNEDSGALASHGRERDGAERDFSCRHRRSVRREQATDDECRKLRLDAERDEAFRDVQRRDDRTGARRRPVQSELGESVRGAATGCSGAAKPKS